MKKLMIIMMGVIMCIFATATYTKAETYRGDIAYTVYDEEGNVLRSGVLSQGSARQSLGSFALKDGQMVKFAPPNSYGFYATQNRKIKFSYKMNQSGYMVTQLYRHRSVREAKNQSMHKGTTLQFVTTTSAYYYALVTNDSGSDKNLYDITFDITAP